MRATQKLPIKVVKLLEKGVIMTNPFSVDIADDVPLERISAEGVVFYGGTRLQGDKILISAHTKLGYESPVTVIDCQLGVNVELKGGFFKKSVFLEKANMASDAHVREACILEEESSGGHAVGLKQTILFPFVTLGSLINFCDCLMAGGTSRKNHSEVGSSFIHFNYTPNQDKATASMMGDVPRGVMLNQPPIFLGGQGGLVGPCRIGYKTVTAAGVICRRDCLEGGKFLGGKTFETDQVFYLGYYGDIERRVRNNVLYIASLLALRQWYIHVRKDFFANDQFGPELFEGSLEKLGMAIRERLKRCDELAEKMDQSIKIAEEFFSAGQKERLIQQKKKFMKNWSQGKVFLVGENEAEVAVDKREMFLGKLYKKCEETKAGYIETIQSLDGETAAYGTAWLQAIVNIINNKVLRIVQ